MNWQAGQLPEVSDPLIKPDKKTAIQEQGGQDGESIAAQMSDELFPD